MIKDKLEAFRKIYYEHLRKLGYNVKEVKLDKNKEINGRSYDTIIIDEVIHDA